MDELNTTTNGTENDDVSGATRTKKMNNNNNNNNNNTSNNKELRSVVIGKAKPLIAMTCATLVYYHCAFRNSTLITLVSDVIIVLICSLAILGLLFRQMNIQVPVDPLEWQISQDTANCLFAGLANTVGATESVLRVAATGHDKRLFLKVVVTLYMLSALGRVVSGVTVAYAGVSLFCLYILAENSSLFATCSPKFIWRRDSPNDVLDTT